MADARINSKKKRELFLELDKRHNGCCTNCGDKVGIVSVLVKEGWEYDKYRNVLTHKDKGVLKVATLEHIVPLCWGGCKSGLSNLTLFCYECNQESGKKYGRWG